tara:strand:- start:144 stop:365 length:222 start_codon:yes stop_codon:yes gene_type:complete
MKVNDIINVDRIGKAPMLVVREMSFKEYCDKHDDLMLEYDADEAWDSWQKNGPCFEVLHPERGMLIVWKYESR